MCNAFWVNGFVVGMGTQSCMGSFVSGLVCGLYSLSFTDQWVFFYNYTC